MSATQSNSPGSSNPSPTATVFTGGNGSSESPDATSSFPGRGGCWTCRLRRKKCDEERNADNACKTCVRLKIDCFGWGPRRPDWMRDKEAVDTYKSNLKAHLSRAGLIRGQPRNKDGESMELSRSSSSGSNRAPAGSSAFRSRAPPMDPGPIVRPPPPPMHRPTSPPTTASLIQYYFDTAWRSQYPHAGNSVPNTSYSIVLEQPAGAVENAVCALASLHQGRTYHDNTESITAYFHRAAVTQLSATRGLYTSSDAIAALHLVSFSVLSGGETDWTPPMSVASDWLSQTGILETNDVHMFYMTMSPEARLAVKTFMYFDILSTVTYMRSPRYLSLYRQLLSTASSSWGHVLPQEQNLCMISFCGWPNTVLLCLAETSNLAHWKSQAIQHRTLSGPELFRRGSLIEESLRRASYVSTAFDEEVSLHDPFELSAMETFTRTPETQRIFSEVYVETAVLYLHVVLNNASPRITEVQNAVSRTLGLFNQLEPSDMERSMTYCVTLAGCMTDHPVHRAAALGRLRSYNPSIGNSIQAATIMNSVWRDRDMHGCSTDPSYSQGFMRGNNLLFV